MLDAHQMNVFLTAAQTLNFTAAARQLHMTQPSVSQHIQALELHFDTPLFVRAGRHLDLTDAGEVLKPLAQEMVQLSRQIDDTMEALKGIVHGHLQVGCSTTIGKYVLPFLLADFMRRYPDVEASCYVTPRRQAVDMLLDGDVHLALASTDEWHKDVEYHPLLSDNVVLIVPLDHPLADRTVVQPEELLAYDFIMREPGSGTREVVAAGLEACGLSLDALRVVLTLGNSEAIALAVQEGVGAGFVSQMIVSRLAPHGVAQVEVAGLSMQQQIFVGRHSGRHANTAQRAFWEFITDGQNEVLDELDLAQANGKWSSLTEMAVVTDAL